MDSMFPLQQIVKPINIVKSRIEYQFNKTFQKPGESQPEVNNEITQQIQITNTQSQYKKSRKAPSQDRRQMNLKHKSSHIEQKFQFNIIKNYVNPNNQNRKKSFDDFEAIDEHLKGSIVYLMQTDINDFMLLEQGNLNKQFNFLEASDWRKIIQQKSLKGYRVCDIQVSLLTQRLQFQQRRLFWTQLAEIEQLKQDLLFQYNPVDQSPVLKIIKLDVSRTFIGDFFQCPNNRKSLEKILSAYSLVDKELGYTQGMNYIVANLLICCDLNHNDQALGDTEVIDNDRDENVYYIFVHIMQKQQWRRLFLDGFPGLIEKIESLKGLLQEQLPTLYNHLLEQEIFTQTTVFQQYYLTLLMQRIPQDFSRIILDLFLLQGGDSLHLIIIAMCKQFYQKILKLEFPELMFYLRDNLVSDFYAIFQHEIADPKRLITILQSNGLIKVQEYELGIEDSTYELINN